MFSVLYFWENFSACETISANIYCPFLMSWELDKFDIVYMVCSFKTFIFMAFGQHNAVLNSIFFLLWLRNTTPLFLIWLEYFDHRRWKSASNQMTNTGICLHMVRYGHMAIYFKNNFPLFLQNWTHRTGTAIMHADAIVFVISWLLFVDLFSVDVSKISISIFWNSYVCSMFL